MLGQLLKLEAVRTLRWHFWGNGPGTPRRLAIPESSPDSFWITGPDPEADNAGGSTARTRQLQALRFQAIYDFQLPISVPASSPLLMEVSGATAPSPGGLPATRCENPPAEVTGRGLPQLLVEGVILLVHGLRLSLPPFPFCCDTLACLLGGGRFPASSSPSPVRLGRESTWAFARLRLAAFVMRSN